MEEMETMSKQNKMKNVEAEDSPLQDGFGRRVIGKGTTPTHSLKRDIVLQLHEATTVLLFEMPTHVNEKLVYFIVRGERSAYMT